jgi:hypothetical protein
MMLNIVYKLYFLLTSRNVEKIIQPCCEIFYKIRELHYFELLYNPLR